MFIRRLNKSSLGNLYFDKETEVFFARAAKRHENELLFSPLKNPEISDTIQLSFVCNTYFINFHVIA